MMKSDAGRCYRKRPDVTYAVPPIFDIVELNLTLGLRGEDTIIVSNLIGALFGGIAIG